MMKLFKYSFLAASLVTLAACSDSSNSVVEVQPKSFDAEGNGYISVGITLPTTTTPGTRANDTFDDGTEDEYAVGDAYLLLFNGAENAAEASATFCGIYPLQTNPFSKHASDQITTESQVTTKIDGQYITQDKLYAYVILNPNGVISGYNASDPSTFTFTTTEGNQAISTATTFGDFSKYTLPASVINNGRGRLFMMTNAALTTKIGGLVGSTPEQGTPYTLATLDMTKIYPTATQAEDNPAGHIDVERVAVKVTVTTDQTALQGHNDVTFTDFAWQLGNTNKTFYNTKQFEKRWLALYAGQTTGYAEGTPLAATIKRFASGATLANDAEHAEAVRTYWGVDPNYDTDIADFSTIFDNPGIAAGNYTFTSGQNAYTTENTLDVAHQSFQNTTYVGISLKFNDGNDFYIIDNYGRSNILQLSKDDGYTGNAQTIKDYFLDVYLANNQEVQDFITGVEGEPNPTKKDNIVFKMTQNETTGVATIASIAPAEGLTFTPSLAEALDVQSLNKAVTIKYYKGGLSYYDVRIKHFGAGGTTTAEGETGCETPWFANIHDINSVEYVYQKWNNAGTSTDYTVAEQEQNFLGRYGVLRNNWYNILVDGVREIGDPVPRTPDGTPDDELEKYISVKIHILPWAVRTQRVIL